MDFRLVRPKGRLVDAGIWDIGVSLQRPPREPYQRLGCGGVLPTIEERTARPLRTYGVLDDRIACHRDAKPATGWSSFGFPSS